MARKILRILYHGSGLTIVALFLTSVYKVVVQSFVRGELLKTLVEGSYINGNLTEYKNELTTELETELINQYMEVLSGGFTSYYDILGFMVVSAFYILSYIFVVSKFPLNKQKKESITN